MDSAKPLFSYRPHWAKRFGPTPFPPLSRAGMEALGWDSCDAVIVSGDAYVDHPSFGAAVIARVLEAQGFRVGVIAQPDWTSAEAFRALGRPNLFFGVTSGNMDSMVNRYTADRKPRHNDAYTPNDEGGRRPDRAAVVYAQRCREAFPGVPVILGGIEASLRRAAHYDYWSDTVRRSILLDSKADLLVYGNGERAIVEIAHRLGRAKGADIRAITDVRGTAFARPEVPADFAVEDHSLPGGPAARAPRGHPRERVVVRLPSFEGVRGDPVLYAHAARTIAREANPGNARALAQRHGEREVWINPPPIPLATAELDAVHALPFARAPHPDYGGARIPAWEMIRFSIAIMRGCFGGCAFCSIAAHEGRIIQSRSEDSVLREIAEVRDRTAGFTGVISDLGGPSANMWRLGCRDARVRDSCRRLSCLHPDICKNLGTDHDPLIRLYRKARALPGVKRVLVASGLRHDLALRSPAYIRELAAHHVGGYLKVAPEHTEPGTLALMMKPGIAVFERFKAAFERASREAGKEQYLIPYFIAAHPGTTDAEMLDLALWLKRNDFRLDQVQTFLPSPMSLAAAMYHSGCDPLRPLAGQRPGAVFSAKGLRQRRLHKAFLRWHDPANWPLIRDALKAMGRTDLIGPAKRQLVPARQPAGFASDGPPTRRRR